MPSRRIALPLLTALLAALLLSACKQDSGTSVPGANSRPAHKLPAELLLLNGRIYTANEQHTEVEALAIRDGEILAMGTSAALSQTYQGPETEVIDLGGRLVLPGLHDSHIHVFGIVKPDVCSLESEPFSLEALVPVLQECLTRYALAPGEWLSVDMWNFSTGNQVSARLPHLRAALDAVSTEHPIILWGNDGHHGAANSAALALARDSTGQTVGLSAATLAAQFSGLRDLVGVDASGEPNGELNEHARDLLDAGPRRDPAVLGKLLPEIGQVLASHGITSVRDAALDLEYLPHLLAFEQSGAMRFRLQSATWLEAARYADPLTGAIDTQAMITDLKAARGMFAGGGLVRADAAKIFADGVLEGNPFGDPPTLPNGAMLQDYRQPRFALDPETGAASVTDYVDTASPLCEETRAAAERYRDPAAANAFRVEHGFHPAQCTLAKGVLVDSEPFIMEYARQLDAAGFNIHIHAIGDRAVRVAVNALEQVVKPGSGNPLRHGLAHMQVVHPDDQQRIGAMGLYLAWTYAWMLVNPPYDMTVIPFIEDVTSPAGIYDPASYYMLNAYPVRTLQELGAVTVAGSDAPVEARSPRPFINMALAVSRSDGENGVLNEAERIDIHDAIAAYTRNGARSMSQEDLLGTIQPGKLADLVVLDRDIIKLYEAGDIAAIASTLVDYTIFEGELIFQRSTD